MYVALHYFSYFLFSLLAMFLEYFEKLYSRAPPVIVVGLAADRHCVYAIGVRQRACVYSGKAYKG